ncbi:hypothetical protein C1I89_14805 [Achromobacter pulmonis]|uniref:Tetracyclin repressor SlmA-like C-terminal domain-containing protein n=2 Tax=Achromobacter pulmonis TaxID=1389932 RepID=A0A2N8KJU4_9BURK|nr:hypothetical protein C1I89_14805 [Achromobacter pulmonis]
MHGRDGRDNDADFFRVVLSVLEARLPKLKSAYREDYAAVLQATAAGIIHIGYRADPLHAELYLREIPRVLTAYLTAIEAAAST